MILLSSDFAGGVAVGSIGMLILLVLAALLFTATLFGRKLKWPEEKEPVDYDGCSALIPPNQNLRTNDH